MSDHSDERNARLTSRLSSRFLVAIVVGPLIGLAIGAIVGFIFFEPGGGGFTITLIGSAIGVTMFALLWAGYSSLESPDPGREPSDTQRPISDRDDLVREEHEQTSSDHTSGEGSSHGLPPESPG